MSKRYGIILVTGGTGSFGNALIQRLLKEDSAAVDEIRIFSRDEKKQHDMRIRYSSPKIKFYIGDVRSFESVDFAMKGVDHVFHAAALKQVPSCEFYPMEAVRTNICGIDNVIRSAGLQGVKKVVCLSTDKAAYPINAMGISKAMMEKVAMANARVMGKTGTVICCTRYGNVMGSRGSVIPLFEKQIQEGGPITVTDPAMTRYMMTLEEAVELVLFAFEKGKQGSLYVQKSPAATIETLMDAMMELKGVKVPIKRIGVRHGEKMYETLLTVEEMEKAIDRGKYFEVPMDDRDLNYELYYESGKAFKKAEAYTSDNTHRLDKEEMKALLVKYGHEK